VTDKPITEVYAKAGEWLFQRGLRNLKDSPGLYRARIDKQWEIKVNAHGTEIESVPPYHFAFEFNGWPAGIVGATGGVIAAGEAANEETLLKAIEDAGVRDSLKETER
jgi:hypothetical protein